MSEEEILNNVKELIERSKFDHDEYDDAELERYYSSIRGLLDLYNKTNGQIEEKTFLYNKLEIESEHLIEKQSTEIKDLENELKRSNDYLDFYKDLCDKQNTLLKNVCTPYGLDKVHYIFMSYTDSNGEDKKLEIRNDNISDKVYVDNKEGE